MNQPLPKRPHILFLFSDTGGGHRSAAEAVREAVYLEYGDRISTGMVDFFQDYAPLFFRKLADWYPVMVRYPRAYGWGFHLLDSRRRAWFVNETAWPYVRRAARRFLSENPSDLLVSFHPVAVGPLLRVSETERPPFVAVVTDMVTTHALWFNPRAALCVVPTQAAQQRALRCGMSPEQVQVIGLPVSDRFCQPGGDRHALRDQLGWPQDQAVILLVGGGDGMGPLEEMANAIAEAGIQATLVIIAGRNTKLKERLEARSWPMPTRIQGFVNDMPAYMQAADVLVTKAGPSTICEAFNAGLPMVIFGHLPGQEEGNVSYAVEEGAGVWAPHPDLIVSALQNWIEHPDQRAKAAAACRRLARPDAARQIAHLLAGLVGLE
jgi:1,2-diacylglycerol 3-beta-galactosyltransferase